MLNRRTFLIATAAGTAAMAAKASSAWSRRSARIAHDNRALVLFDQRFPAASSFAERLAGTVHDLKGLPTELTDLFQSFGNGHGPRWLIGVTPESVPFCLAEFAPHGKRPHLTLRRLDQDLFAWYLRHPT